MRHRLSNGKRWHVERKKILGLCDYESRLLTITPKLKRRKLIDVTIHEVLHAELPKMREKKIERVATSCARLVFRVLKREGLLRRKHK